MERKNIYVVLGAGRSGTSAIARSLKVLGIDLGNILRPKGERNPKGFWEDSSILALNRILFRELGDPWMSTRFLDQANCERVFARYAPHAETILKNRLANTSHWAFKDPRTAVMLPFWQTAFRAMNVEEHYVIALRNPLATASSIRKITGEDLEMILMMWLVNMIAIIDGTENKKRVVVSYESMLQQPLIELQRIRTALDVTLKTDPQAADEYAKEFLDKNLRHHVFDLADLKTHVPMQVSPLCVRVYELLLKVATDEMTMESEVFKQSWNDIKTDFAGFIPIYQYIHTLTLRNQAMSKTMRSIQKSIPWSLLRPLRWIENIFREWKKQSGAKRRLAKVNKLT